MNTTHHTALSRRSSRARLVATVALAACTLIAVGCGDGSTGAGGAGSSVPATFTGAVVTPAPDVATATLPVADTGEPFSFTAPKGRLLVTYFGYTACPDVCPTTLADLKAAFRKLGAPSKQVDVAMATIDPRRDTSEIISNYLHGFFPDATALRTDDDTALRAVTDRFGATYEVRYPNNSEPTVEHSAFLYVTDDTGTVVLEWPFGSTAADMAADMKLLLAGERPAP